MTTYFQIDKSELLKYEKTDEGYLNVYMRIAKVGDMKYHIDGKEITQHVPKEALFDKDSIKSFKGKPITLEHPPTKITSDNSRQYMRGLTSPYAVIDGDFLGIIATITDKELIEDIERGNRTEVSCGYDCKLEKVTDTYWVQKKRIGNHIAITTKGRAGSDINVQMDSNPSQLTYSDYFTDSGDPTIPETVFNVNVQDNKNSQKELSNAQHSQLDNIKTKSIVKKPINTVMQTFTLDGIKFDTESIDLVKHATQVDSQLSDLKTEIETLTSKVKTLTSDSESLDSEKDALQAQLDSANSEKDKLQAQIDQLTQQLKDKQSDSVDVGEVIKSKLELIANVSPFISDSSIIDFGMSDVDLKKAALKSKYPEINYDSKSEDYVNAGFDMLLSSKAEETSTNLDSFLENLSKSRKEKSTEINSDGQSVVNSAYESYKKDLESAWSVK